MPGALKRSSAAHALHELDDLRAEPLRRARRADAHDLELALDVGIVDPVVEAAALQRVVDLARAVARDDDDRRRASARTVPSSGMVSWFSARTSSRKASNGSSARSSSSISSTGERGLRQRLQQRPLDQHARARRGSAPRRSRAAASPTSCAASARRISIICRATFHSYARLRDVEAFVALHAQQARAERARQRLGELGLADARLALEEQRALQLQREEDRGREAAVGDVVLGGEQRDDGVDRRRHAAAAEPWHADAPRAAPRPRRRARRARSARAAPAPPRARRHHADHRGAVLGRAVQVAVDAVGRHLHRLAPPRA